MSGFQVIQHSGPGRIQRGSDIFYIEPSDTQTNVVYVSATGNDSTNDGLSASYPIKTLTRIKVMLVNTTANQRGGTWEFRFAAGTYSDSTNFPDLPFFRNAIRFIGAGSSRTPLTIFDGNTAAYKTAGMYFLNRTNVYLQYIKFQNFTTGYGVLAEKQCQLELVDCDANNCLIGFAAGYSSFIRTTRCTATNCDKGFSASSNSQASFVPSTDSIIDSNRAYTCGYGFAVTRMSYAHIDYNEIEDCTYAGVIIEMNSRSAMLANNFKRNTVAVRCWTSGYAAMDATKPNIYNQSGADANTEVYEFRGSSGLVGTHGQSGTMNTSVYKSTPAITLTGTNNATQIGSDLYTAQAGWLIDNTKRVRVKVWGRSTTPIDGEVYLQFRVAGTTTLGMLSLPSGLTDQTFVFESEHIPTDASNQKTFSKLLYGVGESSIGIRSHTIDYRTVDRDFSFWVDANGVGGPNTSTTIEYIELEICG